MFRLVAIVLLCLVILPNYGWSAEGSDNSIAICLLDIDASSDGDLEYIIKAVKKTISNRLSQFPNIIVYPGESAPARYFREPEKIITADKVRLLQIRRETGFDGLIFGRAEESEGIVSLALHLVDFSSGRVYFSGELQHTFGSELFSELEKKVSVYVNNLISYYYRILTITSDPGGAEVMINGEAAGVTPIDKLHVRDGVMQVRMEMEGYMPFETEVDLQVGQKGAVHAQLSRQSLPVISSLTATSQPPGADLYMDDQFLGTTPIKNLVLKQQNFNIKFSHEGYAPYSESISLNPGQKVYIHAQLHGVLDSKFQKKPGWRIDAHNFSFFQTLEIQDLEEFDIKAYPAINFRYYAKFGGAAAGFGISVNRLNVDQSFDTFMGDDEGYEPLTMDIVKGTIFARKNILESPNRMELYLGGFTGFSLSTVTQNDAPSDMDNIQRVGPLIGGELGLSLYLVRVLKISAVAGSYYAGRLEYAAKGASYWGEPKYERRLVKLHPFYIGFELAFSFWPGLM